MSFINFSNLTPFITGVVGGILFDMATHGVDQDFVQRLTANRTIKGAQIAIISSSFLSILVAVLFLSIGSLLWAHYQSVSPPQVSNDQLFAYFITNYFPTGIKGLMVAGVLAATMSTLDSTINALSASFYSDIKFNKNQSKSSYQKDTLLITALLMIVAFISSKSDGLLLLGLKITSWTAGSLLSLFFASVLWNKWLKVRLDTASVIGTYALGVTAVYFNTYIWKLAWQWNVYFAFIVGIIFLKIKAKIFDR
jgi:Na+/proline symporter